jgi:hypothetical protein
MFGIRQEEVVGLSLYVPLLLDRSATAHLHQICSTRQQRSGEEAKQNALARKLAIARGKEQGVAGRAFASAQPLSVADDDSEIYYNFDREMKKLWRSEPRDWRSILAIPVMDLKTWLPIGVIVATSNLADAFWTRFGARDDRYKQELFTMMREAADFILGGFNQSAADARS